LFEPVEPIYAAMVRAIAESEPVHINVADAAMERRAQKHLVEAGAKGEIAFHHVPTNDAWCRDHGAIFVVGRMGNGEWGMEEAGEPFAIRHSPVAATKWRYNAWGGKYPHDLDDLVAGRMAEILRVPRFEQDMVLEGGSIDVNGCGGLLTTEACLLNPNRNPDLTREQIEERLQSGLGVEEILWLGDGIAGDDTDGHIDDLTRFIAKRTVVTVVESDPADENYEPLRENLRRLRLMTVAGRPLEVVELPMPPALVYEGQRLPASYANFYITNRSVLLPGYDRKTDARAKAVLAEQFPGREIVVIDCTDLIWGLGAFHCLTQQVPKAE
jgi:agmatine deiminase